MTKRIPLPEIELQLLRFTREELNTLKASVEYWLEDSNDGTATDAGIKAFKVLKAKLEALL